MKFLSQINVNTEYTLPFVDGNNGQVLTTDGQGAVYWGSVSAGATSLDGLTDVEITSPQAGQILNYSVPLGGTVPVWRNITSPYAPIASPTFTGIPAAPTAPTATNTTQIATTAFVKAQGYLSSASSINDLSDVTISTVATGQILQWSGTQWVNATLSTVEYVSKVQHLVKCGVAVTKGQAVYVTSADGTNMIVGLASNATEATSSKVIGLAASTGVINDQIFVVTEGLIAGLNTSTATAGDPVWLGTGGNLIFGLANKPVAPAHLVYLGVVTRVQSNNGEIFVNVQNGFELNELHDVLISSPSTGQLIRRDSDGLWKNWSPNFLTSYTETDPIFSASAAAGITSTNITNWNTAYNDSIRAVAFNTTNGVLTLTQQDAGTLTVDLDGRYLTSFSESDPIFEASAAASITNEDIAAWDTAYGWGNHADYGYLTSLPVHNHDDRYYTETESDSRFVNTSGDTMSGSLSFDQAAVIKKRITQNGFNPVKTSSGVLTSISDNSSGYTYYVIETNVPQDDYQMGGFTIELFGRYGETNNKTKIDLAGYWNPEGNGGFSGFEAHGTNPQYKPTIEVSRNSQGNTAFIIYGVSWSYPVIVARDLWLGYNSTDGGTYGEGWTIRGTNDVSSYTNKDTVVWRNAYSDSNPAGYITGYTETDTLASVTGRGATTSNLITINSSDVGLKVQENGTSTAWRGRIGSFNSSADKSSFLGNYTGRPGVFAHNNALTAWDDLWVNTLGIYGQGNLYLSWNTYVKGNGNDTNYSIWHAGNDGAASGLDADLLDGQHGSYYQPASTAITTSNIGSQSVAYAGEAGFVSNQGGQLLRFDNRTISPSETSAGYLQFGFTSWANNNTGVWADYLHLRSYTDGSGGNDNLVMFKKDGIGMRIWQQSWGSSSAYSSYADVWTTENFSQTNVNKWNEAYGWGNHADAGYLTNYSYTETDTLATVTSRGGSTGSAVVMYGKVTLGNNSSGTYNGNTNGLTLNSTAEIRSTSVQNPPALTWHYEGLATRHLLMTSAGAMNFVSPSNEASGVAVLQVNGNTVWHAGNDGSGSGLDADLLDGYNHSNFIGLNGNSYFQLTTWLQSTGTHGFYSPSSGAGTHFYPAVTSYGSFRIEGGANSFLGIELFTLTRKPTWMWDNNGGGMYSQSDSVWYYYYSHSSGRLHIGASSGNAVWHSGDFTSTNISNWNAAYNDRITAVAVSGTGTKTLTLTQQDGGTLTATWTDYDTDNDAQTLSWDQGQTLLSISGGNDITLTGLATEDYVNSQGFVTSSGTVAGVVRTVTGTNSAELVRGNMGDNDQARILVGATASNAGYLEIATADDGTEPIYVRQYTGTFTTEARTATLLDGSGNTTFPGSLTIGGTFTENSSIRFKENIQPLEPALAKVEQLNPVTYTKITSQEEEIGLIAEEVAELFPEVVTYNEAGQPQGIQYQRLSVILLKAVQELTERVNKLENK